MLTEAEQESIVNVFDRPDIAYINPGREDGKREDVQKRYLSWALRDLLNIINGVKLDGMSNNTFSDTFGKDLTFSSLIYYIKFQKHLIYNRDIPQGSSLCEVCKKACLLAKGINKSRNVTLPANLHNLV